MMVKYFYIYFPYIFFKYIGIIQDKHCQTISLFIEYKKDCTVQCMCMGNVMFLPVVQSDNILLKEAVRYNTCGFVFGNTAFYLYMSI